MKHTYLVVFFVLALTGCSEYQKALKKGDVKTKYELAEKLYNEGDYKRANRLLEQIVPQYVGKPQGERLIFFFANSYYQIGEYFLAAYQFDRFAKSYPRSDKAEEAAFLGAKSQYLISPRYSLDQTETNKAIDKLQIFINTYPESEYMDEANKMAADMRAKLEKKAFEIAKQYNRISDYYASIKSFELFFEEFPGSIYKEDALYYQYLAKYNVAVNSIPFKKEERINNAKEAYDKLISEFPDSKYKNEAEKMNKNLGDEMIALERLIEKISK